jgi:putative ABC transport system permease protein
MFFSLARIWRKLWFRLRREQLCRELEEEIEAHAQFKRVELHERGITDRREAAGVRRGMGNITLAREESRDLWSFPSIEHLLQDTRYACRIFRRNPGFSTVAIFSLALGIAGNVAIFSIINAVLLQPLPFRDPGELLRITELYPKAVLRMFQQQCRTLDIASVSPGREFNLTGDGPATRIMGSAVSTNLFSVLGVTTAEGRNFQPGEDRPGEDGVIILSNELWRTEFHRDPNVLGRSIAIAGVHRRVVGIMPPGFVFPSHKVQFWIPARMDPSKLDDYWGGEFVPLVARLKPGATIAQARGEIHQLTANLWKLFPFPMPRRWAADATLISLQEDLARNASGRLFILLSAVGAVLLIACANVASLLLSRAMTRRKEMAMRNALGAGSLRIVRQLLTESVVLALVAGVLGIGLGSAALSVFLPLIPSDMPAAVHIGIDCRVAGFALAISFLTGILFGITPALQARKLDLVSEMKTGSQRSTTRSWIALRSYLIAAEVTVTLVLLIGAGLLLRSLYALSTVDPGFNPKRIVAVKISPDESFCAQRAACVAFYRQLVEKARGLSGVADAAVANTLPLDGQLPSLPADVEDHPKTADFPAPMLWAGAVSPDYFRLMQIPLIAGRQFNSEDGANAPPVVLVTASTARHFWPGENVLGKHIKTVNESQWRTIVGVVADVRQFDLENHSPSSISGAFYMPYAQAVQGDGQVPAVMNLVAKTAANATNVGSEIRRLAREANPNIPVGNVTTLTNAIGGSLSTYRSTIRIFLCFACVAIVLAAIGIYGLLSYSVSQRTYEIGLRMAMGATRGSIAALILRQSVRVILAGMTAGLSVSFILTRFLSGLLFGVAATDGKTFALVSIFLLVVALAASLAPAMRAARIAPIRTLRTE